MSLPVERKNRIIELYSQGQTIRDIADALGHSTKTVHGVVQRNRISRPIGRRPLDGETVSSLLADYQSGMTLVQVAEKHGYSISRVYYYLRNAGVIRGNEVINFIPDNVKQEIMTDYDLGWTIRHLMQKYLLPARVIRKILFGSYRIRNHEKMIQDYLSGREAKPTYSEIAEHLVLNESVVRRIVDRLSLQSQIAAKDV